MRSSRRKPTRRRATVSGGWARWAGRRLAALRPFRPDPPPARVAPADPPTVSVVVTNYNYAHYLGAALDSVLAQSCPAHEIIVVDDGSTDDSAALISAYGARHPCIIPCGHPDGGNHGLSATLRLGLAQASGEYVAFCEADDLWTPDHLAEKIGLIQAYGRPAWIANDVELFGDRWRCLKMELANARRIRARCRCTLISFAPGEFRRANWILTFSCCMARRADLLGLDLAGNPWPEHTDWWLWRQMAARYPLHYLNRRLTYWRMHRSYVTRAKPSPERWRQFRAAMDRLDLV
ncbi:MAG: glycosyltransferase family 2 protein [Candidatus Marinimicrobia bacterium]|nr:glycosyltransferase family 2 protein [Candidatus Neomarinimicrobiota bacterium]